MISSECPPMEPPPSDCENLLSKDNKATATITNKKGKSKVVKLKKCRALQRPPFDSLCSADALGGKGKPCCKFCEGTNNHFLGLGYT